MYTVVQSMQQSIFFNLQLSGRYYILIAAYRLPGAVIKIHVWRDGLEVENTG